MNAVPERLQRIIAKFFEEGVTSLTPTTRPNGSHSFIWKTFLFIVTPSSNGIFTFRSDTCDVEFMIVETKATGGTFAYQLTLKSLYSTRPQPPDGIDYKDLIPIFKRADVVWVVDMATLKMNRQKRLDMMYLLTRTLDGAPSKYGYYQDIVEYPNRLRSLHDAIRTYKLDIDRKEYLNMSQAGRIEHLRSTIRRLQKITEDSNFEENFHSFLEKEGMNNQGAMFYLYDRTMVLRGPPRRA